MATRRAMAAAAAPRLLRWLLALLPALGPPPAAGCGVTVHSEVARRAPLSMQLPDKGAEDAVRRYPYVVDAGAPFPDYLYACGTDHDDGEYAHWHQFHHHFVDYIREKHPQWNSGDEHGAKLVAFLMGLTSHYIADINWHGMGQAKTGFIEQVGLQDMGCDGNLCQTAHQTCDVGGEFVINMQMRASNLDPLRWWIPTADIVAVFARAGIAVQPKWINECALLFAAELIGVQLAEPVAWAVYARRAAMLEQSLEDFFIGGLDDNAAWSALVWSEVVDWLHGNGTAPTLRRAAELAVKPAWALKGAAAAGRAQPRVVEVEGGAVEITVQDAPRGAPAAGAPPADIAAGDDAAALSYLGSAVVACDLDGDGTPDPVVGAPGLRAGGRPLVGAVHVLLGGAAGAEREVVLQGEAILARFGSALACADLNGNGVPELFVAAPTEGPWEVQRGPDPDWYFENQSYFGAVHAFEWNGTALAPAWAWRSDSFLGVCGSALAAVGGRLVVGCPFASAGAGTSGRVVALDHAGALVWEARGDSLGARLGASLAALPSLGLVAAGAPGLRGAGGAIATGAVLLLDGATGALVARLDSSEVGAQFGRALAADGATLWVGAPGATATVLGASLPDAGRVDQFAVSRANGTATLVKQRSLKAFFPEAFAEFGLSLAPLASGQGVAVGAPLADFERGRVHVFSAAGARLPSHEGTSAHGRFGAALAAMGGTLLVGAPKESTGPRVLAGAPRQGLLHRVKLGRLLELQI